MVEYQHLASRREQKLRQHFSRIPRSGEFTISQAVYRGTLTYRMFWPHQMMAGGVQGNSALFYHHPADT